MSPVADMKEMNFSPCSVGNVCEANRSMLLIQFTHPGAVFRFPDAGKVGYEDKQYLPLRYRLVPQNYLIADVW
jgi:hypothetical protein